MLVLADPAKIAETRPAKWAVPVELDGDPNLHKISQSYSTASTEQTALDCALEAGSEEQEASSV